jgi:hypothetical protein
MYAQLDLELMHKRSKNNRIPSNFNKFGSEEVIYKTPPKKTLMFGCYNLVDPME